ncbi:MAG: hypothetical protein CMB89_09200 [Flammeovirgaceae bacterium]|nr:hypothetical protein [Flammeovirgaceae bacterium]
MKLRFLAYIGTLAFLLSGLSVVHMFDFSYESQHPTLNEESISPDVHLQNAIHYTKKDADYTRSLYHIDQAIQSIKYLETDIDNNTNEIVDEAVQKLIYIYEQLNKDTLKTKDMNHAFEFALTSLTLAELRISERYAESNNMKLSRVALKYAQLHLKHALGYTVEEDARNYEKHLQQEIDSLLANYDEAPVLITERIDLLINEIDSLLNLERSTISNLN